MINKKGQSLVIFIIIMPVFLIMFATIVEHCYLSYMKRKVNIITSDALSVCLDSCEKNDIINLYDRNDLNIESLDIIQDENITIDVKVKIDSYINKLINQDDYIVHVKLSKEKGND